MRSDYFSFTFPAISPQISMFDRLTQFADRLARETGAAILRDYASVVHEVKPDGSLVTRADRFADAKLHAAIRAEFPDHGILTEEGDRTLPDTEFCWIVDPIDGTTNFTRSIPVWGVSLGLLYRGVPVFGLVHFPPLSQTFYGSDPGDTGLDLPIAAFLNGEPIGAAREDLSGQHFFSVCTRSVDKVHHPLPCKVRMLGASTYNLLTVALGSCLGAIEATPKIWDIAAVWPIVRASGAMWCFLDRSGLPVDRLPLVAGRDYTDETFPVLVVARSEFYGVFAERLDLGAIAGL
jgi:myo-inositol-1(or 4)-monophosphatase